MVEFKSEMWCIKAAVLLVAIVESLQAVPIDLEIGTEWDGTPVTHVPVVVTLDSSDDQFLSITVQAPFFNDPAPPAGDNSNYVGLSDYEVVDVFIANDDDLYLQVEVAPLGQYFVALYEGGDSKRFSLPVSVAANIQGDTWTATVEVPTSYLPPMVSKVNAYSTHGVTPDRHYEAYSPSADPTAPPDYHDLTTFAPIDLDEVIPGLSSLPMSQLWEDALVGRIRYSVDTFWNGASTGHTPINFTLEGNVDEVLLYIEAPFFDDPPPPGGKPGEAYTDLYMYEVIEVFFLNDEKQYVEVEVGPYGEHWVLLLWSINDVYNQLRHSLALEVTTAISGDTWTGLARIPVDYLPPKVSLFNGYAKHIPGTDRHEESLYPQDPTDPIADFHALKYFQPIDMNSIVPGQSELPMSQFWDDSIQGIFTYSIVTEWNSVPIIDHGPTDFTLQGYGAGLEMNVSAAFFDDPPPGGEAGQPFYGLWDYEVVEMFFLNKDEEYLEVELGPWGQHLLLMLKGQRTVIKHSLPLDYVVTERQTGQNGEPGTWQGRALIPQEYFPPNVMYMNAYAIHGTGDARTYESLYPAPLDDPNYPEPDFHSLDLFQEIDFNFLVANNSQYSQLWLDAIANSTANST